ncbi:MAG TPA: phosphotransferase, partial [Nitrospirota bacterium]
FLDGPDRKRIEILAGYLAGIHSRGRQSPRLYLRKVRDIIGHGECLMGVLDTYSEAGDAAGFTSLAEMADIEKSCVDWRARLKPLTGRLCTIHGDFHPGNILFGAADEFILLDRSRGEYGDAADDLTAFAINFIFFSLMEYGTMRSAYREALEYFFDEYIRETGDRQVLSVLGPFFAFRGAVVANPLFYPDVSFEVRSKIFGFVHGMLKSEVFDPAKVDEYMDYGIEYRKRFA